jgi:large subunit ribosomal protein L24
VGKEIKDGQKYPEQSVNTMPIPISAIRLVHPITDPATGVTRDVIIRTLQHANVRRDRLTRTTEWDRYVPGLNVIIPWPEKAEPQEETTPADTPRKNVQEATFVPSLLSPPMPTELVNELRNRYSRFRTRHEEWYLQKKQAEADAKKATKQVAESMLTPVQEFTRQRRATRKALGQPKLSEEMLQKIGSLMVKNSQTAKMAPNKSK